jgi:hypothetical protein
VISRAAWSPDLPGIEMSRMARCTSSAGEGQPDRRVAVWRFRDDLQVGLGVEHVAQAAHHDRVVVGDQDVGLQRRHLVPHPP